MKALLKKSLAIILALSMILGCMTVSAFAVEGEPEAYPQTQVVSNGKEETPANGKGRVKTSKIITQTGQDSFDITLTVKTSEEVTQQTLSQDAAVVIVLDASNSIKSSVSNVKSGAKEFVSQFVPSDLTADAKRMVSIVEFGNNGKTMLGWTNANAEGKKDEINGVIDQYKNGFSYSYEEPQYETQWFNNNSRDKNYKPCNVAGCKSNNWHSHEILTGTKTVTKNDNGGTNLEAGMLLAKNLLNAETVKNYKNRYVIVLTDGKPTYHSKDGNSTSTEFIEWSGNDDSGNTANESDYKPPITLGTAMKADGIKIYSVTYKAPSGKVGDEYASVADYLAAFVTQNITENDDAFEALKNIAQIIVNQAKAWVLDDPMGDMMTGFSCPGAVRATEAELLAGDQVVGYATDSNKLIWNLKNDVTFTKKDDWKTYTLTYSVKLNTEAENFESGKTYPANKPTTLTFMLSNDQGELQKELYTSDIQVPQVKGWKHTTVTVNRYYDEVKIVNGAAVQPTFDVEPVTETFPAANQEKLNVGDSFTYEIPESAYAGGYALVEAKSDDCTISELAAADNVINLYFSRDLLKDATVTEVHHFTHNYYALNEETGKYEPVSETLTDKTIVDKLGGHKEQEVFGLTTTEGGGYVLDTAREGGAITVVNATLSEDGKSMTLAGGDAKADLYFILNEEIPAAETTAKVEHYFTYSKTEIVNGAPVTTSFSQVLNADETVSGAGYVGETFTGSALANPTITYNEVEYTGFTRVDTEATKSITLDANASNNVIRFDYNYSYVPESTTLTIKHVYRDYELQTVEVDGEETQQTVLVKSTEKTEPTKASYYVGEQESYTLAYEVPAEGYTANWTDSTIDENDAIYANGQTVIIYYDRDLGDNRDEASITVKYVYTTLLTYIKNGELATDEVVTVKNTENDYAVTDKKSGDEVTAEAKSTYEGMAYPDKAYSLVGDLPSAKLHSGENEGLVVNYKRSVTDLTATTYTVNYIYKVRNMTVKDGVAGYWDDAVTEDTVLGTAINGYVNEIVYRDADATTVHNEKNYDRITPERISITLKADSDENVIEIVYLREQPLPLATITVDHTYDKDVWSYKNGQLVNDPEHYDAEQIVITGKYVGESVSVFEVLDHGCLFSKLTFNGSEVSKNAERPVLRLMLGAASDPYYAGYTFTAGATNAVKFFYTGEERPTQDTTVTVIHRYYTKDFEGTIKRIGIDEISPDKAKDYVGREYVIVPVTEMYGIDDFEVESIVANTGEVVDNKLILAAEDNVIEIEYIAYIDTPTSVKVIHEYITKKLNGTLVTDSTDEVTDDKVLAGDKYVAAIADKEGYVCQSPDEADRTIEHLSATPEENVITIKYIKTEVYNGGGGYDPDPKPPVDEPTEKLEDEDVPLADAPEEILEEEVPLADVPFTGELNATLYIIGMLTAFVIAAFNLTKKEEEE